jgi:hypothetical protein
VTISVRAVCMGNQPTKGAITVVSTGQKDGSATSMRTHTIHKDTITHMSYFNMEVLMTVQGCVGQGVRHNRRGEGDLHPRFG